MRSLMLLAAVVASGGAVALLARPFGDTLMAGYGLGVVWMLGASLTINSPASAA